MRSLSLIRSIARSTGESCRTIRHRGFSKVRRRSHCHQTLVLTVGLICPGCGTSLPLLQHPGDALPELVECLRCDAFYPYDVEELQVLELWPVSPLQPLVLPIPA